MQQVLSCKIEKKQCHVAICFHKEIHSAKKNVQYWLVGGWKSSMSVIVLAQVDGVTSYKDPYISYPFGVTAKT